MTGRRREGKAGSEGRMRLAAAEVTRSRGSSLAIRIRLERGDQAWEARTSGVGLETMELRLSAEATLSALGEAAGDAERLPFQLVGVKVVHAFDAEVVLVSVRETSTGRRLIGAVAVEEGLAGAAARATLDATNRVLFHPGPGDEDAAAAEEEAAKG